MATVADVCWLLSETTGMPLTELKHRAQRIREAGLLPQGGRGINAPHVGPVDMARLIIGAMATLNSPAVKAAKAVQEIGSLVGPEIRILPDPEKAPDREIVMAPEGTFADALACFIRQVFSVFDSPGTSDRGLCGGAVVLMGQDRTVSLVSNLILTLDGPSPNAWIEIPRILVKSTAGRPQEKPSQSIRFMYGDPPELPWGMVQEVKLSGYVLQNLVALGPLPDQQLFEKSGSDEPLDTEAPQGLIRAAVLLAYSNRYREEAEGMSAQQREAAEKNFRSIQKMFGL